MRVLVTGCAGFIGSHLVKELLALGHEVVGLDNMDDYYLGKIAVLEGLRGHRSFRFIMGDILDLPTLTEAMEGVGAVVHLAAQAGVGFSVLDPMRSHRVNVVGTLNVLEAAREAGVKRMVNSSSSSVYGNPLRMPTDEGTPADPISPYGASKLSAEAYCRLYHHLYGMETISLRYFTVYGPHQRPDMAIRLFADRIAGGERPQIFGDGEQTRDFTFIDDVTRAIILAMDCPHPSAQAINICCGRGISVNRLVRMMLEKMGREDLEPEYLPPKPGDVQHTLGDNSLARRLLGWAPRFDIEEGLDRFLAWFEGMNRWR